MEQLPAGAFYEHGGVFEGVYNEFIVGVEPRECFCVNVLADSQ